VARLLIEAAGVPIAAPSANRSEHVSPTTAQHVLDDLEGKIDIILDSGPTRMGIESVVIDCACDEPKILRPGPVRLEDLEQVIGRPFDRTKPEPTATPASPGQHARHYAPKTRCVRAETPEEFASLAVGERDVVIAFRNVDDIEIDADYAVIDHPIQAAQQLYATLRELDEGGYDRMVILMPADLPIWEAVRDRLRRATVPAADAAAD
jgi:L-threonylcarbamoyladenylate synthase